MSEREYGKEIDELKEQINKILQVIQLPTQEGQIVNRPSSLEASNLTVFYSGHYKTNQENYHVILQEKSLESISLFSAGKMANILAALGNKQRLEIIRTLLIKPKTASELVELLNMGTTGQLYHHLKPLLGSNLISQDERGGAYKVPIERTLPLLLLLSAVTEIYDTGSYLSLMDVRENAEDYIGENNKHNPNQLILAILQNSIQEHRAKHCNKVLVILHEDGSATVSDDGRGIPTKFLAGINNFKVQDVLTNVENKYTNYIASSAKKGLEISIVNALSSRLKAIIRRDGYIYFQDFKHGIPLSRPSIIGESTSTGTSLSILPNKEIFPNSFDYDALNSTIMDLRKSNPELTISLLDQR
ncbi:ATP-binding protein [Neobacillus sp. YIM B06451]|uniref:ATP-binding protein n=1 Tax=Neobacillus sp. YIM B06451 TaxID=3070994 RepID=UPI00292CD21B|nr:ATP-binding protein [Neobacillus sp. YIM B06451]